MILIALFAFWKLDFAERNLTSVKEFVNKTPVTLTFKDNLKTKGIVFLAHGFAGSTSFMRPIAVALAEAGYLTVRFDFLGMDVTLYRTQGILQRLRERPRNLLNKRMR